MFRYTPLNCQHTEILLQRETPTKITNSKIFVPENKKKKHTLRKKAVKLKKLSRKLKKKKKYNNFICDLSGEQRKEIDETIIEMYGDFL